MTPAKAAETDDAKVGEFSSRLLNWFDRHGRKNLPWQHPRSGYRTWIAEVMLQQTQVKTVIPYFENFIQRFPDIPSLARAPLDDLLASWSGLGYYRRAHHLHRAAEIMVAEYGGKMPQTMEAVIQLPGIGRSTAGAILAQAFGLRYPILDGNVRRVLCRYHALAGWPGKSEVQRELWDLADRYTPPEHVADYTQAIMDLGATICNRRPDCTLCPLQHGCHAFKNNSVLQYPYPKPPTKRGFKRCTMPIILNHHNEIWLERRPNSGIWSGLWSLAECADSREADQWVTNHFGSSSANGLELPPLEHQFTHFTLMIEPRLYRYSVEVAPQMVMEADRTLWYKTHREDSIGMPAPIRQIIAAISNFI